MSNTYILQVQNDEGDWENVTTDSGELLRFETEDSAREKLRELYPVLVQLEEYASGPKRTRVLIEEPYADKDE